MERRILKTEHGAFALMTSLYRNNNGLGFIEEEMNTKADIRGLVENL